MTKRQALYRVKRMLQREWNLNSEPLSRDNLRAAPPAGLGKNGNSIRALETPIETVDFADVNARVTGAALASAQEVRDIRDVVWDGLP